MRILIVDTSPDWQHLLLRRLSHLGHHTELANNFDSGRALVSNFAPNLIVIRARSEQKAAAALARAAKELSSPAPCIVAVGEEIASRHIDLWLPDDDDLERIVRNLDAND
jgi:DNA-binding response OmpR family regulator